MAKPCGLEQYKGFLIDGSAVPTFATGFNWYSQGIILRPGRLSSIIEVKRVEGLIFNSKEAAEEHGLELCKTGLTNGLDPPLTRSYRCLDYVWTLHRYV
jgi:hypothetical protein